MSSATGQRSTAQLYAINSGSDGLPDQPLMCGSNAASDRKADCPVAVASTANVNRYAVRAGMAIRLARLKYSTAARFAADLGASLDRGSLARQTVYAWEAGKVIAPASALLAAADLIGVDVSTLLTAADTLARPRSA